VQDRLAAGRLAPLEDAPGSHVAVRTAA